MRRTLCLIALLMGTALPAIFPAQAQDRERAAEVEQIEQHRHAAAALAWLQQDLQQQQDD